MIPPIVSRPRKMANQWLKIQVEPLCDNKKDQIDEMSSQPPNFTITTPNSSSARNVEYSLHSIDSAKQNITP